eukprot:Colp12_sorted_trinity150504_noHs@14055
MEAQTLSFMEILPVEILENIFSYLTLKDLVLISSVCHRWCELSRSGIYWKLPFRKMKKKVLCWGKRREGESYYSAFARCHNMGNGDRLKLYAERLGKSFTLLVGHESRAWKPIVKEKIDGFSDAARDAHRQQAVNAYDFIYGRSCARLGRADELELRTRLCQLFKFEERLFHVFREIPRDPQNNENSEDLRFLALALAYSGNRRALLARVCAVLEEALMRWNHKCDLAPQPQRKRMRRLVRTRIKQWLDFFSDLFSHLPPTATNVSFFLINDSGSTSIYQPVGRAHLLL